MIFGKHKIQVNNHRLNKYEPREELSGGPSKVIQTSSLDFVLASVNNDKKNHLKNEETFKTSKQINYVKFKINKS